MNDTKDKKITTADCEDCFFQASTNTIIDLVHPLTGRSIYAGENLEEIQKRYPGAVQVPWELAWEQKQEKEKRPVQEITGEKFEEMLCCLPPRGWRNGGAAESFKISEMWSGNITDIFCRIGEKFYTLRDVVSLDHDEICKRCKAFAG